MTATPIPRSLELTFWGHVDVSVLDEMPPGRQPVKTRVLSPRERGRAYAYIQGQVDKESKLSSSTRWSNPLTRSTLAPRLTSMRDFSARFSHVRDLGCFTAGCALLTRMRSWPPLRLATSMSLWRHR